MAKKETDVLGIALSPVAAPPLATVEAPPSGVRLVTVTERASILCYAHGVLEEDVEPEDPWKRLAAGAARGDAVAVRRLLDAAAPAMLGVVRAILGSRDRDVEDVLQDALVGLVQGLGSFRGDSSVLHFARSIALRRSLDQRRKRARRGPEIPLQAELSTDDDDRSYEGELRSSERSPASNALAARRREAFRAILEDLRPEQAEAFAQRVLFGHSMQEIALQTNVSVDTVKSRLRLAKAALRARIQDDPTLLELSEIDDVDAP